MSLCVGNPVLLKYRAKQQQIYWPDHINHLTLIGSKQVNRVIVQIKIFDIQLLSAFYLFFILKQILYKTNQYKI